MPRPFAMPHQPTSHDQLATPDQPTIPDQPASVDRLPMPDRTVRRPDDVVVRVLGTVDIVGLQRPFVRGAAQDLVVYLVLHPGGARNEVWADALWPDRPVSAATLHSVASAARRSLGPAPAGGDRLPRAHGSLCLGRGVTSDWQEFGLLSASADPRAWDRALSLVRGQPFDGLARPDWTVLEGSMADVQERIVEVADRLAGHRLVAGDGAGAGRAARAGLRASPYDERLYRRLLEAADRQGNPGGVESVMGELVAVLGGGGPAGGPLRDRAGRGRLSPERCADVVHPQTAELYMRLSRRTAATGGMPDRL